MDTYSKNHSCGKQDPPGERLDQNVNPQYGVLAAVSCCHARAFCSTYYRILGNGMAFFDVVRVVVVGTDNCAEEQGRGSRYTHRAPHLVVSLWESGYIAVVARCSAFQEPREES